VESLRVGIRPTVLLQAVFEEVPVQVNRVSSTMHPAKLTAPKHCSRAVCQPGRYGDGGSIAGGASSASNRHCDAGTSGACTNAEVDSAAAKSKHTSPLVILSSDCDFEKCGECVGDGMTALWAASKADQCDCGWGVWN
jgi:hypothetical protein